MGRTVAQMMIQGQSAEHLADTCLALASLPDARAFSELSGHTAEIENLTHGQFYLEEDATKLKDALQSAIANANELSFPESRFQRSEHASRFPGAVDVELSTQQFTTRFSGYPFGVRTGIYLDFRPANIDEVQIPFKIENDINPLTGNYPLKHSFDQSSPSGVVKLASSQKDENP